MKLSDRGFLGLEALSVVCGELTFCIAAGVWFGMSQVNWFAVWTIQLTIVLCWALGTLFAWFTAKSAKNISCRTYVWTNCVYAAVTVYGVCNGDASVNGWYVLFCIGFAIVSLPGFALMTIINAITNNMADRRKAIASVLLTALPLVAVNLMGSKLGIGKEDMIKEVANEVIGMVDDFKDRNGRLPVGLDELGAPFEEINETYEYKDYIFYYEPRKDGYYWLTITFGPDENYCYESKNGSWIWDCDSDRVEMYKENALKRGLGTVPDNEAAGDETDI